MTVRKRRWTDKHGRAREAWEVSVCITLPGEGSGATHR